MRFFHQQCFVDKGEDHCWKEALRSTVTLRIVEGAICIFGACTDVPVTKELLKAVNKLIRYMLYFFRRNASKYYLKRRKGKTVSRLKKHK